MEIVVHQLLCGENSKRAWDLLQTTMPDISVAKSIAFKTDLHDQAGGITWQPTIRGFMQENYFLLIKTFPDKSPDVRTGRAFSHVLLIPKKDIDSITDIGFLFKYLPNEIDKSSSIKPIIINSKEISGVIFPMGFQERFNKAIHGYRNFNEYKKTIIWVGEQNFEQAVSRLWQILSSKEKVSINFGIYFNIVAIPKSKLNFITAPENIESKFINQGFCLIRKNDTHTLTDISEQILAGHEGASQRINKFQQAIEAKSFSRTDIDKVAIVIKTFEELDSTTDIKKLNSLASIIGDYSPDEKKGIVIKEKLVAKIKELIESGAVTDILLIRKFNVKSFKDSESKFITTLNNWLDKYLLSNSESTQENGVTLFRYLRESITKNWWTRTIEEKVKAFMSEINSDSVTNIYRWLYLDFAIFKEIQPNINSSNEAENYFVSEFPSSFEKLNYPALKEFAVKRKWYKFYSTLLVSEYSFKEALTKYLEVDSASNYLDGIEIIIQGVNQKSIIDFAISKGDNRLLNIAGKLCYNDPSLLEKIDFTNFYWQEVWLNSIDDENRITDGFKQPKKMMFKLFDTMIDGNSINEKLLEKIYETEFGNLQDYPNTEKLWLQFSYELRIKFLAKTSLSLLESISKNPTVVIPADRILSDYILNYAIGDFLYYNPIRTTLPILSKFPSYPEGHIVNYITNYKWQVSAIEATQLGKLIQERRYYDVAQFVFNISTSFNNWRIALAECYTLLHYLTQIRIAFTRIIKNINIDADMWWEGIEEIIIDLYSNPNSLNTIWKKSGGNEADLLMNTNVRDVWSNALQNLRKGNYPSIDMCSLLKQIKKNYGGNENFKTLFALRKNFISC